MHYLNSRIIEQVVSNNMDEKQLKKAADAISKMEVNQDELDAIRLGTNRKVLRCGNLNVIEHPNGDYGVVDKDGHVIVPFGKYGWIDGFSLGLARVRTKGKHGRVGNIIGIVDLDGPLNIMGKAEVIKYIDEDRKNNPQLYAKWGIINAQGEEVLPLEYDDIWGFYGSDISFTTVEKDGESRQVSLYKLNPTLRAAHVMKKARQRSNNYDYPEYPDYYDSEGFLDEERLEDAYLDGEWVPDDI